MNSAEMKVARFEGEDVIATSVPESIYQFMTTVDTLDFLDDGENFVCISGTKLIGGHRFSNTKTGGASVYYDSPDQLNKDIEFAEYMLIEKGGKTMSLYELLLTLDDDKKDDTYNGTYYLTDSNIFHFQSN